MKPLLLLLFASTLCAADVKLGSWFSDGAVVQRNQKIAVWGSADPGAAVQIELGSQHAQATAGPDGAWRADLSPMPAGGPFVLKASAAGKTAEARDILCGDVWLCAGQSNMQMTAIECVGGEQAVAEAANYPRVRFLSMGKGGADEPRKTFDAKWQRATPETAGKFAAVGFFFAQTLLKDPALKDVPLGLINSSFGGTSGEAWTPAQDISWVTADQRSGSMFNIKPSALYNAMIAPLAPAGLTGVIWYQGEANAGHPEVYPRVLTSLIEGWRRQFARPELPFFIVELPPYANKFGPHYFTWLREAQAKVAKQVPHCALVTTLNTTDGEDLHPRTKREIGRRAALLAQRDLYGEKITAQGPLFKSARADGARLRVTFDSPLVSRNPEQVRGFQLAGPDGVYWFADASLDGADALVQSKSVPNPKTVRYAWAGIPDADLLNRDGLPAPPFRTDDLPPSDTEFQPTPVLRRLVTKNIDLTVDERGSIRSLILGGQQILSNSPGNNGGTSLPTGKGFQELPDWIALQPDRLLFYNKTQSLEITGDDDSATLTLKNDNKDDVSLRLMLASAVAAKATNGAILIERANAKSKIEGAATLQPPGPDGQPVLLAAPAHGAATLKISREK